MWLLLTLLLLVADSEFTTLDTSSTTLFYGEPQALFLVFNPGVMPLEGDIKILANQVLCIFLVDGLPADIHYPLPYKVKQWKQMSPGSYYAEEVPGVGGQLVEPTCPKRNPVPGGKLKKWRPGDPQEI